MTAKYNVLMRAGLAIAGLVAVAVVVLLVIDGNDAVPTPQCDPASAIYYVDENRPTCVPSANIAFLACLDQRARKVSNTSLVERKLAPDVGVGDLKLKLKASATANKTTESVPQNPENEAKIVDACRHLLPGAAGHEGQTRMRENTNIGTVDVNNTTGTVHVQVGDITVKEAPKPGANAPSAVNLAPSANR